MQDKQNKLLIDMVLKIDEARTYNRIYGVITLVWLIEFFYTFFWTQKFDYMYWTIWVVCMVGWIHLNKKFRFAMKEYKTLKEEYEDTI
jgi:hypothetical protein